METLKKVLDGEGVLNGENQQHGSVLPFFGVKIVENKMIPPNIVRMVNAQGKTIQVYDLTKGK